jgi:hypothetical protein
LKEKHCLQNRARQEHNGLIQGIQAANRQFPTDDS